MADITEERKYIQEEETAYRAAVAESTMNRVGAAINFINKRQYDTKAFFLNGYYAKVTAPQTAADGFYIFPFDVEVFDAAIFNVVAGSSGTTELDVKVATASGGSFSSIFSTTPKIASSAGANAWVKVGGSGTGLTAPVLSGGTGLFNINAGSAIRVDKMAVQSGTPENCGIIIYFRPR